MHAVTGIDALLHQPPHYSLGFILAGGHSSRMGSDKAKLRIGAHSMLDIAKSVLDAAALNQHYVVGGDAADLTEQHPGQGPASAICHIISQVNCHPAQLAFLLFIPVDMPCLSSYSLNTLLECARRNGQAVYYANHYLPLVIPVCPDSSQVAAALIAADPCPSVRKLLAGLDAQPIVFSGDNNELINVNRPEELARLTGGVK